MTREEFQDKVADMLEEVYADGSEFVFTDKAKTILKECAEYARETTLYIENEAGANEFWSETTENAVYRATPTNVYRHILERIVNAPTRLHMIASVIIHIPTLDRLVNGGVQNE